MFLRREIRLSPELSHRHRLLTEEEKESARLLCTLGQLGDALRVDHRQEELLPVPKRAVAEQLHRLSRGGETTLAEPRPHSQSEDFPLLPDQLVVLRA